MVALFSFLLLLGIVLGQILNLSAYHHFITFITSVCLTYIMIEVGYEFSIEKKSINTYGKDFLVAASAAIFPVILLFCYFIFFLNSEWKPALVSGLSAAPTSAGVLFTMMLAAGLGSTWVFNKARVLAVLDDLVTILLLTPITIIINGFKWESILTLFIIGAFLFAAFRWQKSIYCPYTRPWMFVYAVLLTLIVSLLNNTVHIHLEVLIPAFMWGCLIKHNGPEVEENHGIVSLDKVVKGLFMLMVGLSLPKIIMANYGVGQTIVHVLILTVLANVGKLFLLCCYRQESTFKERLALGVAMFPRGEVGAAVLLIGIGYGFTGIENTLAVLSLALNLVLTGVFIWVVIRLNNQYRK